MKAIDLHCDTLSVLRRAHKEGVERTLDENDGHIDLNKLEKGDYMLQCFAAFVFLKGEEDPFVAALEEIDEFYAAMDRYADRIAPVKTWADLERNRAAGKLSAMLTIEEGGVCKGNPALLRTLYRLGARIMTLTWNFENELAWPNSFDFEHGTATPDNAHGLTERGREFVAEMERLGLIVDVSHLGDAGFWDVAHMATRPFIASHSNARAVCPHVRNLTDEMLHALADKGGVTGINFCGDFLDPGEKPYSSVRWMAEHIEHIRAVAGIDAIALGSDFDGIEPDVEMGDCSGMPRLADELHRRGFTDDEIEKIYHGNALRVLREFLPEK